MEKLFISHSSKDNDFVRELREALELHGQDGWIDSRELRGGDPLWPEIQKAIKEASAFAVVVSPDALQSDWVGDELAYALELQKKRGKDKFPVLPLSLNGTKLGILKRLFNEKPLYISVSSAPGGVDAAIDPIFVALGKRKPHEISKTPQPKAEPVEELVLELTGLNFHEQDGVRRASARARLIYEPATSGQDKVYSPQSWNFIAPIGPIEAEELRWYLEKFAIWPSEYFRDRARKVEENLVKWGQLLYAAALPDAHTTNVMNVWTRIKGDVGRRFSIHVDSVIDANTPKTEVVTARESASILLGLPWELLHDGNRFLFQGAQPIRVRRRIPRTEGFYVPVVATPIRVLLVTARPEDESCSYIDHRASALPLVDAMEALGGLVHIHVLDPPTLDALREELDRARRDGKPYHVLHFDGHGVYDRNIGLGALCFENPQDIEKLEKRMHATVFTNELGPLLRDYRIPLVFLDACQTAQAEKASESVASELLKVGIASVVAMSHSVLVETARRFVEVFYAALSKGARVGDAMLKGQRKLKDDTFRGRIFGAGELRLEDWFVPILFQEKDDPQLFKTTPSKQTQEDLKIALKARLGDLPPEPETGFIGRSRELLALQRLLHQERYAVVRGQGGEGKTALAAEFARWMVRSQQIHRAAFVSVEGLEKNLVESVLDKLGHQLVKQKFSTQVDCGSRVEEAEKEITRALTEQPTLIIMDNLESILPPPYIETPEVLSEEVRRELETILQLCACLNAKGDTRIVFTSREALPSPFDAKRHRCELQQLDREDAIKLIERVLNREATGAGEVADATREQIEQLVDAVHCHARTLALLAPALRSLGVEATHASLVELMAEMDRKFPHSREKSVFASVELSLRRMLPENRNKVRVLGVFHGGFQLDMLRAMMDWKKEDVISLANELIAIGLATPNRYDHLTLNPALCPYLRRQMKPAEHEVLTIRWYEEMQEYTEFLRQQRRQNIELAATLTVLDLPELFALLKHVQGAGDAEVMIDLAASLFSLLRNAGKPRYSNVWPKCVMLLQQQWARRGITHNSRCSRSESSSSLKAAACAKH